MDFKGFFRYLALRVGSAAPRREVAVSPPPLPPLPPSSGSPGSVLVDIPPPVFSFFVPDRSELRLR